MSFRIEEKLYFKPEHLIQFREYLTKKTAKKLHSPRIIESLYFDNIKNQQPEKPSKEDSDDKDDDLYFDNRLKK